MNSDSLNIEPKVDIPFYHSIDLDWKEIDSSFLKIYLYIDHYQIAFKNDSLATCDTKLIDAFVKKWIKKINKENVVLIGDGKLPYKSFKPIRIILKKYEIYKFRLFPVKIE